MCVRACDRERDKEAERQAVANKLHFIYPAADDTRIAYGPKNEILQVIFLIQRGMLQRTNATKNSLYQ
jgi:hypothetical protein